jgi:VWFA-related protein
MAQSTTGLAAEDPLVVSFYVSVFDKNGKPVENLIQKDFQILEDKVPQTITALRFERNTPVSLGILIDISRGMGTGGTNETLGWVKSLAQRMRSPDEFFVNAFSDESQEVVDYISPEDYLDDPIDKLGVGGQSRTGLAVDLALIKIRDARNPKRGLLVISPGRDIAGKATLEHIAKSRLPVYGLGISGTAGFGGIMDRVKSLNVKGSALVVYAGQSGGDVIFVDSPDMGNQWLEKFYSEFRSQYLVEYRSTNSKRDGKLRRIEVRVPDPTYSLRYLRKYLAPYTPSSHLRF